MVKGKKHTCAKEVKKQLKGYQFSGESPDHYILHIKIAKQIKVNLKETI